jgi:hypothetical protein
MISTNTHSPYASCDPLWESGVDVLNARLVRSRMTGEKCRCDDSAHDNNGVEDQ